MAGRWRRQTATTVTAALLGLAWAGEPPATRSDRAVGALVGVLLCLAVGLAVAWRHLCRVSAGRYHPRPMGRRAMAMLRERWRRLRGGRAERPRQGDGEVTDVPVAPRDEEELMPWSQEQRRKEEEEEEEEEEKQEEEEEEAEAAVEAQPAAGGSAEALLSDLHAFSGTAAWGDTRPHVTAL